MHERNDTDQRVTDRASVPHPSAWTTSTTGPPTGSTPGRGRPVRRAIIARFIDRLPCERNGTSDRAVSMPQGPQRAGDEQHRRGTRNLSRSFSPSVPRLAITDASPTGRTPARWLSPVQQPGVCQTIATGASCSISRRVGHPPGPLALTIAGNLSQGPSHRADRRGSASNAGTAEKTIGPTFPVGTGTRGRPNAALDSSPATCDRA